MTAQTKSRHALTRDGFLRIAAVSLIDLGSELNLSG
jgi:hypothetical protein